MEVNEKDTNFVRVSVGTKDGVEKNHTLEVYRLEPRAEYLGALRVLESFHDKCVAVRLKSSLPLSPLKIGDNVVGEIGVDPPAKPAQRKLRPSLRE